MLMFGQSIYIEKIFTTIELKKALSKVFAIEPERIRFIKDINNWLSVEDIDMICELGLTNCEYRIVGDIDVINPALRYEQPQQLLINLSKELDCNILMSDKSVCPYTWDCIKPDGSIENISFDVEQYDNAEYQSLI